MSKKTDQSLLKCFSRKIFSWNYSCLFHPLVFTIKTTVVLKRESKWHNLWSKWPISDLVFYNIKMPPCSCPLGSSLLLTGALKWGTVQTSTSTDTGIMKGQS